MEHIEEPDGSPEPPCGCADEDVAPRRRGRWRLALAVLLGEPVVPESLLAQWLDYRVMFDDLLKRLSAQLARQAKAEHKRIRKQLAAPEEPAHRNVAGKSGKQRVRAIMAASRGMRVHSAVVPAIIPAPEPDPEDE